MIETSRISELISKYRISPTQIYILWMLYTKDDKAIEEYIKVFGFKKEDFKELIDKGLLLHTNSKAESYITTDLVVTLELVEHLVKIEPDEAYEELFQLYPAFLNINGKDVSAKGLTFSDEKAAKAAYASIISKDRFLHKRILEAVVKYKKDNNGYATVKIDKFLTSRLWEDLENKTDDTVRPSYY